MVYELTISGTFLCRINPHGLAFIFKLEHKAHGTFGGRQEFFLSLFVIHELAIIVT